MAHRGPYGCGSAWELGGQEVPLVAWLGLKLYFHSKRTAFVQTLLYTRWLRKGLGEDQCVCWVGEVLTSPKLLLCVSAVQEKASPEEHSPALRS